MNKKYLYLHNPKCSKSRLGLEFLKEREIDFELIEYLKDLTPEIVQSLSQKLPEGLARAIRFKEEAYTQLKQSKDLENLSENQWAEIILENPKLLERPILVSEDKAIIGRPTENFTQILGPSA